MGLRASIAGNTMAASLVCLRGYGKCDRTIRNPGKPLTYDLAFAGSDGSCVPRPQLFVYTGGHRRDHNAALLTYLLCEPSVKWVRGRAKPLQPSRGRITLDSKDEQI